MSGWVFFPCESVLEGQNMLDLIGSLAAFGGISG